MTINQMDLIKPEDFIQKVLEEDVSAYIYHIMMMKSCLFQVHPFWMAQILATTAETVRLIVVYKDFEDVFSARNSDHLLLHEDHDHAIDFVDRKKLYYWLIYSLFENESSIFWAYIDNNLVKILIRSLKSSADTPIFFVPKLNRSF